MSNFEMDDDASVHMLEGSSGGAGGLIIMKKGPAGESNGHSFKKPVVQRPSLLGLDKLAAAKKKTKDGDESPYTRKSQLLSYKNDWEENSEDIDDRKSKSSRHKEPKER